MPVFAGVDVGSTWAKAVVLDGSGTQRGWGIAPTGLDLARAGTRALEEACGQAGLAASDVTGMVSTGYGRDDVPGHELTRSEIMCLARGAFALFGRAMTVIDIGGQDSKVVILDAAGKRVDYRLNRKCAAGTGAFIEMVCLRLGVPVAELNALAAKTEVVAPLSSFCSVFAATEVIDLLRKGFGGEAIARGVYRSVAQRVADIGPKGSLLALSGGVVAHHPLLVDAVRELLKVQVEVLPNPQHVSALGAALLAREGGTTRS